MKRVKQQSYDVKSHLAIETCNIYQNAHYHFPCIHHKSFYDLQSPFIDWYLILRVEEDASIDTIKKQYHKLALLLHPDKNKHPKAEFAFKLISQAYNYLSDEVKRTSFNSERWKNLCSKCSNNHTSNGERARASPPSTRNSRPFKVLEDFRAIRERLEEEIRVIEGCIRVHQGSSKDFYPVFDPSNYSHLGYPHIRRPHHHHHLYYDRRRRERCESPVFELRTHCSPLNSSSTCVSS